MSQQPDTRPRPASNGTDTAPKTGVLLVDDDKFLLDMYVMKFTAKGYDVHACLSVSDALKTLRGGFKPDAIVFDVIMPEHDGFYFLTTIAAENLRGGAAIIGLTNESGDDAKAKITELGADKTIVKATMIPSEVVNTVEEEIAKRKS
ncbi:MAG: response regulator [bacterium]|nr:response regulator [bacterium]